MAPGTRLGRSDRLDRRRRGRAARQRANASAGDQSGRDDRAEQPRRTGRPDCHPTAGRRTNGGAGWSNSRAEPPDQHAKRKPANHHPAGNAATEAQDHLQRPAASGLSRWRLRSQGRQTWA